jgi:hypothetical protein
VPSKRANANISCFGPDRVQNKALMKVLARREIQLPAVERGAVPNFLCWSDDAVFATELEGAGFVDVCVFPVKKRFNLTDSAAAVQMWHDMSASFPTLNYVFETIGGEAREELEAEVAAEFANVIHEQRGAGNSFGYLEGTAMFGIGHKQHGR